MGQSVEVAGIGYEEGEDSEEKGEREGGKVERKAAVSEPGRHLPQVFGS